MNSALRIIVVAAIACASQARCEDVSQLQQKEMIAAALQPDGKGAPLLSEKETLEVKSSLEGYEKGTRTFEEVTKGEWPKTTINLIKYYQVHSNEVTLKMLLPVSRCYGMASKGIEAAALAQSYLNVYSNDSRGWDVLAAAKLITGSKTEALETMKKSVSLGSNKNLSGLGILAYDAGRKDIIESLVIPRALAVKKSARDVTTKQEILRFLVYYSLETKNKRLFVDTLQGMGVAEIAVDEEMKGLVLQGCELFKAEETQKLCLELAK